MYRNWSDLVNVFQRLDYRWIGLACVFYMTHLVVGSWRWRWLMRIQNISITFSETLSMLMQGFFFSLVIPGGAVGGDVVKAGLIASKTPKGTRLEGMFTILVDRVIGMVSLFSLMILVSLFSWEHISRLDSAMRVVVLAILAACVAGLSASAVLFFHRTIERIRLCAWVIAKADKFSGGAYSRVSAALDLYRDSYKALFVMTIASFFAIHLNIVLVAYCVALGVVGQGLSFHVILLGTLFGATASLLPITPSGVGTRDYVMREIFRSGGLSAGVATAIPLIFTSVVLMFNLLGGLFFIFQPKGVAVIEPMKETGNDEAADS